MKNIAIITARGGSKRIPRKNIKKFLGKPMISYAINACLESNIFDEVMVSTDDDEIANIALAYGAKIPFMRNHETSGDFATTYDVLEEVILKYRKLDKNFSTICCVYPCVPFLTSTILKTAYTKFQEKEYNFLVPIVKFSYPIQRAFRMEKECLKYNQEEYIKMRSQDLEPMYHDVGMFYFATINKMLVDKTLVGEKTTYYEMKEIEVQDIDTEDDWKMAELKYKILHNLV